MRKSFNFIFLFPVGVESKSTNNNKCNQQKNNTKSLHYFSPPLLRYIPKQSVTLKTIHVAIRKKTGNFMKTSLAKKTAKIILEKSKKVFDSFSICRFVSFINIIPPFVAFVNHKLQNFTCDVKNIIQSLYEFFVNFKIRTVLVLCSGVFVAILTGYFLIMWLGIKGTLYRVSVVDMLIGLVGLLFIRRSFGMLFLPVRIYSNSAKNQGNNEYYKKKDCKLVHFYSSLLNKMPNIKSKTKMITPRENATFVIFSGVAILPITNAIKSAWHKLRKILANCFRWFLSSFITNIISQINLFVNPVRSFISLRLGVKNFWHNKFCETSNGVKCIFHATKNIIQNLCEFSVNICGSRNREKGVFETNAEKY